MPRPLQVESSHDILGDLMVQGNLLVNNSIRLAQATQDLIIAAADQAALRTYTIPDAGANDTFTMLAATQTLTNKTLTLPVIASISNTGTVTFPTGADTLLGRASADTITGVKTFTTPPIIQAASATALTVGLNGATNPAFSVDSSVASQATGWQSKGAAAAAGAALAVTSSAAFEQGTVDAKGAGALLLGTVSTGPVIMGRGSNLAPVNAITLTVAADNSVTLTAAQLLGGLIEGPVTAARTYTFDTAANLDAAFTVAANGAAPATKDQFKCDIINTSAGANAITLAAGGTTLKGSTSTIAQNRMATVVFRRTGPAAWTSYVNVSG